MKIDEYLEQELDRLAMVARVNAIHLRQPRIVESMYNGVKLKCMARTRLEDDGKGGQRLSLYKGVLYGVEDCGPYGRDWLIYDLTYETWKDV